MKIVYMPKSHGTFPLSHFPIFPFSHYILVGMVRYGSLLYVYIHVTVLRTHARTHGSYHSTLLYSTPVNANTASCHRRIVLALRTLVGQSVGLNIWCGLIWYAPRNLSAKDGYVVHALHDGGCTVHMRICAYVHTCIVWIWYLLLCVMCGNVWCYHECRFGYLRVFVPCLGFGLDWRLEVGSCTCPLLMEIKQFFSLWWWWYTLDVSCCILHRVENETVFELYKSTHMISFLNHGISKEKRLVARTFFFSFLFFSFLAYPVCHLCDIWYTRAHKYCVQCSTVQHSKYVPRWYGTSLIPEPLLGHVLLLQILRVLITQLEMDILHRLLDPLLTP